MPSCGCCANRFVNTLGTCGCSAVLCRSCLHCERHCTCTPAAAPPTFLYDLTGKIEVVDALPLATNFTYDTGPEADPPILVPA